MTIVRYTRCYLLRVRDKDFVGLLTNMALLIRDKRLMLNKFVSIVNCYSPFHRAHKILYARVYFRAIPSRTTILCLPSKMRSTTIDPPFCKKVIFETFPSRFI